MRVAVTGATGFVGGHLVRRLTSEGHQVAALVHRRRSDSPFDSQVTSVVAAVDDPSALESAIAGAEAVCHLVGIIAPTRTKTFEGTVVQGTRNVVTAAKMTGVRRLIYLSAMGTSADAPSQYHQAKYIAEETIRESGLEFVILRPSVIYGPGDGFVSMLEGFIHRSPFVPVIGSGRFRMQPVHIDDVTQAIVVALASESASGRVIDLGGPEKLEYVTIIDILKKALGKRRVNLHMPTSVMRCVASLMEMIIRPAPLTRDQITMMEMGNTGDITAMRELLNIEPVAFADGLARYVRKSNG